MTYETFGSQDIHDSGTLKSRQEPTLTDYCHQLAIVFAMLTAHQINLVQDSFAAVVPITDGAAAEFYRRLFELAPDARSLFHNDMAEQGRKLFLTLATVVDALDRLDTIVPVARELAIRHVAYGAREHHYAAVGSALIETLRFGLGSVFERETEAAWLAAYAILSNTMLAAVREKV